MALEACRECGKEVSTEAHACPHCGVPMDEKPKAQTTTTQLTSKKWKAHNIVSSVIIAVGIFIMIMGITSDKCLAFIACNSILRCPGLQELSSLDCAAFIIGLLVVGVGVVWRKWAGIMSWWHHD